MQAGQVSPGVIIKALEEEIVKREVRIRTLEDNVTALQLQIEPLNEENRAFRAQVAWGQVNAMKQQEQLSKLAQVNQSLTAEIQGLRHALFNLSQENTNLRMRLDSTRAPVPHVTAQKASGKAGNAKLQATTASSVPQQQELPPPVPVTVLVQQESEPVHAPTQPEQKVGPAKVELEPQAVPVSVMAQQEETPVQPVVQEPPVQPKVQETTVQPEVQEFPVQQEVQEPPVQQEVQEPPVQPEVQEFPVQQEVQEPPAPVSTAEEPPALTPVAQPSTRTEEERAARREEKRARERAYKAQQQAVRELQAAEAARVAAEEKAEAARAAAEKKAQKEAVKQAEAREKERKARETEENAKRAREKAEKRMQAQLAREEEERILELKEQEELFKQEMARLEKEAQAKKNAEKEKALLAEAEKEGERLEKEFQPSMHHSMPPDCDQELAFALLVGVMKENKVKDPIPQMQTFLKGMTQAKTLEYICRALFELDTPSHGLRYDKFKGVSCKISVGSVLELRAMEQYKNLVSVRQAFNESDLWQLTVQFNAASLPFYSPKVPLETISHWLDSKKLFKVIEDFSAIQTAEVGKCSLPGWTQSTIGTAIKGILALDRKLFEDLKTDFDPAGDETDYWGMKKVQITYKKRSSDGTAKTVTKRMTRTQLIDWYLLGNLSVLFSTSCYLDAK